MTRTRGPALGRPLRWLVVVALAGLPLLGIAAPAHADAVPGVQDEVEGGVEGPRPPVDVRAEVLFGCGAIDVYLYNDRDTAADFTVAWHADPAETVTVDAAQTSSLRLEDDLQDERPLTITVDGIDLSEDHLQIAVPRCDGEPAATFAFDPDECPQTVTVTLIAAGSYNPMEYAIQGPGDELPQTMTAGPMSDAAVSVPALPGETITVWSPAVADPVAAFTVPPCTDVEVPDVEVPDVDPPLVQPPPAPPAPAPPAPAPVVESPVTQAPVTQAPVTQAPVTQAPVAQAPVVAAPVQAPPPEVAVSSVRFEAAPEPAPTPDSPPEPEPVLEQTDPDPAQETRVLGTKVAAPTVPSDSGPPRTELLAGAGGLLVLLTAAGVVLVGRSRRA